MPQAAMTFIEAWMLEHFDPEVVRSGDQTARVRELARWLRRDAAGDGFSDADIDAAVDSRIGAGHGLVDYLSEAMATDADATVPSPEAERLADEDV